MVPPVERFCTSIFGIFLPPFISHQYFHCTYRYHTHPFEYDPSAPASHCYLSGTDVTTQLQWQRTEDQSGRSTPWLAIVIDPLRSLAKGKPELMAFRVYPPDYQSTSGEAPDGKILSDAQGQKLWGSCWRRYYRLEVSYFMSSLAQQTFRILKNNLSWTDPFENVPGEDEILLLLTYVSC